MQQLGNISRLPVVTDHIAVMPDVHLGKGATVGSVIPTESAIIPASVGVDIGCGMVAVQLTLTAKDLPDSLAAIRAQIERDVPVGVGMHKEKRFHDSHAKMLEPGLLSILTDAPGLLGRRKEKNAWALQIGTLGTGNHFIEICLDELDNVWVMLHSGSRGIGHAIGSYYIEKAKEYARNSGIHLTDSELAWLPSTDPAFHHYWNALSWAQEYAMINRKVMVDEVLNGLRRHLRPFQVVDAGVNCHHNYVAKETHNNRELYITRKGAIRAGRGDMGIIPSSMGTVSYIVEGLGNADSFCSCSHGAGRIMSRSEAKLRFTQEDVLEQTKGVECRKDAGVIDEIPGAYKEIEWVMSQQKDLVRIVAKLRQVLCVKG